MIATAPKNALEDGLKDLKVLSMNPDELDNFLERASIDELQEVISKILLVKEEIEKEIRKVSDELQILLRRQEQDVGFLEKMSAFLQKKRRNVERISLYLLQALEKRHAKKAEKTLEKKKHDLKDLLKTAEQVEKTVAYSSTGDTSDISTLHDLIEQRAVTEDEIDRLTNELKKEINAIKKMERYHNLFPTDTEIKEVKASFHDLVKKLNAIAKKEARYLQQYLLDDVQNMIDKARGYEETGYDHATRKSIVDELKDIEEKASSIISDQKAEEQKTLDAEKKDAEVKRLQAEQKRKHDEQERKTQKKSTPKKEKKVSTKKTATKEKDDQKLEDIRNRQQQLINTLATLNTLSDDIKEIVKRKKEKDPAA